MILVRKTVLTVFLMSFFVSCQQDTTIVSDDYVKRLQSVLEVSADKVNDDDSQLSLDYPAPRDLKQTASINILSIREFLSLRECALHTIIAKRNSLIGKVAPQSQILFNDLEILHNIPDCVLTLQKNGRHGLSEKLIRYQKQKTQYLNQSLWQAILGQKENAQFWRVKPQPKDYPRSFNNSSVQSINALIKFIGQVKLGDYNFNQQQTDEIERHLQKLSLGDAGQLYSQLTKLTANLELANQAISQRLEQPLCLNDKPTEKSRYFQNVVNKFFIDKVQVNTVHLVQRYRQLLPRYLELEKSLNTATPKAYRQWKQQRDHSFQRALTISKQHVVYVQQLYDQCGLSVSNRH